MSDHAKNGYARNGRRPLVSPVHAKNDDRLSASTLIITMRGRESRLPRDRVRRVNGHDDDVPRLRTFLLN